jgi:hypothetical protein
MQRAILQQATFTDIQSQAVRVLPGRAADLENQAVNDESYQDDSSVLWLVLSVLANVIGGTILLAGMFFLPHLVARILS